MKRPIDSIQDKDLYQVWNVQWRNPQFKKHKTWDNDGTLIVTSNSLTLKDTNGNYVGKSNQNKYAELRDGDEITVSGKDCYLDRRTADDRSSVKENLPLKKPNTGSTANTIKKPSMNPVNNPLKRLVGVSSVKFYTTSPSAPFKSHNKESQDESEFNSRSISSTETSSSTKPSSTSKSTIPHVGPPIDSRPSIDSYGPDALIMKRPSHELVNQLNPKQLPMTDVVVDHELSSKLRPHQKEGVKFMYECVMGMKGHKGQGCILADEMGLGKTLQVITLIWTMLKQNVTKNQGPLLEKVMIVCPVSLVHNWRKEFNKWIGQNKVGIFVGDKDVTEIKKFQQSRIHQILIIGYEKLRSSVDVLKYCQPPIGLIVCDEGHRLKSANNKTTKIFESFKTRKRIILSGTPIQNDLGEYYCMTDFCNPGLLDSYTDFKKKYEIPIVKSRAPNCLKHEMEIGRQRQDALTKLNNQFVLRRTANVLENVLPPKTEYVVFIAPTILQLKVYKKIIKSSAVSKILNGSAPHFSLINLLKQICNSPGLILNAINNNSSHDQFKNSKYTDNDEVINNNDFEIESTRELFGSNLNPYDFSLSGKLKLLGQLLQKLKKETDEKIVIVSSYTKTLDLFENHCRIMKYKFARLDGSTPQTRRQEIVDGFNRSTQLSKFVFLLSTKSGGVGLNLIGASRLVLFEGDWNPSVDLQAMARIHRDGQQKPVYIYRFLTTGTIDEKIYQRQLTKMGLSDSLMSNTFDKKNETDSFTTEELKALYGIENDTISGTHDLLECNCNLSKPSKNLNINESNDYKKIKENDDGDSDIEEQGFVTGSQFHTQYQDKIKLKMESDRKAKLAALEGWNHIDCLNSNKINNISDTLTQNLVKRNESNVNIEEIESKNDVDNDNRYIKHNFESFDDYCPASDEDIEQADDDKCPRYNDDDINNDIYTNHNDNYLFNMSNFLENDENNQGRITFLFERVSGKTLSG